MRRLPERQREAINEANAVAFSAPTRTHRRDGQVGEERWAARWTASFESAAARYASFTDAEMSKFLGRPE